MVLTLIAKERKSKDGKQRWYNFSVLRNGTWYDVKFVHEAATPKVWDIDKPNKVMRAFIDVDAMGSNVAKKGMRNILYVEIYKNVEKDALRSYVDAEREALRKFREKRDKETRDFFSDDTPPSSVNVKRNEPSVGDEDVPPEDDEELVF